MLDEEIIKELKPKFVRVMIRVKNALVVEGRCSPESTDLGLIGAQVVRCMMRSKLGRELSDAELEVISDGFMKSMNQAD